MAPCSVVPSTSAVPTEASDSEHMNNSGDESTQEYFPETTDAGRDCYSMTGSLSISLVT